MNFAENLKLYHQKDAKDILESPLKTYISTRSYDLLMLLLDNVINYVNTKLSDEYKYNLVGFGRSGYSLAFLIKVISQKNNFDVFKYQMIPISVLRDLNNKTIKEGMSKFLKRPFILLDESLKTGFSLSMFYNFIQNENRINRFNFNNSFSYLSIYYNTYFDKSELRDTIKNNVQNFSMDHFFEVSLISDSIDINFNSDFDADTPKTNSSVNYLNIYFKSLVENKTSEVCDKIFEISFDFQTCSKLIKAVIRDILVPRKEIKCINLYYCDKQADSFNILLGIFLKYYFKQKEVVDFTLRFKEYKDLLNLGTKDESKDDINILLTYNFKSLYHYLLFQQDYFKFEKIYILDPENINIDSVISRDIEKFVKINDF